MLKGISSHPALKKRSILLLALRHKYLPGCFFQLDLIHVFRDTSFKLWQDREMTLEDRKRIIRRLGTLLFSLKNSVEKHRKDRNLDALKGRTSKPFSPFSSSISIGRYEPCIPTTSTVSPSTPCHDISAIGGLSG